MSRVLSARRKKLLAALGVAGRENSDVVVLFHTAIAGRMGLGPTEEKTLGLLERIGPLTAGEIVAHTGLAPASVTGLIDRLAAKGFVRRAKAGPDRRRVTVEIDHSHIAQFAGLFDPLVEGLNRIYGDYTDDQLELILGFLRAATEVQRAAIAALET